MNRRWKDLFFLVPLVIGLFVTACAPDGVDPGIVATDVAATVGALDATADTGALATAAATVEGELAMAATSSAASETEVTASPTPEQAPTQPPSPPPPPTQQAPPPPPPPAPTIPPPTAPPNTATPAPTSTPVPSATPRVQFTSDGVVEEKDGDVWVELDSEIHPGDTVQFSASGWIWAGVALTGENGPDGWLDWVTCDDQKPLPCARPYSLLADFGEGYFAVGSMTEATYAGPEPISGVTLRINDDVPGNGYGSFSVTIRVIPRS